MIMLPKEILWAKSEEKSGLQNKFLKKCKNRVFRLIFVKKTKTKNLGWGSFTRVGRVTGRLGYRKQASLFFKPYRSYIVYISKASIYLSCIIEKRQQGNIVSLISYIY